jgi:hypothetical protein
MGLLTTLLTLPVAPVRGVLAIAQVIKMEADRQLYDPAAIRREIEEVDAAADRGDLGGDERQEAEQRLVGRLTGGGGTDAVSGRG